MKAEEMKRGAINSQKIEIDKIESSIREASGKGSLSLLVSSLTEATIAYLRDNGFKVVPHTTAYGTMYNID